MSKEDQAKRNDFEISIEKYPFDSGGIESALIDLTGRHSWPLVYLLTDMHRAYVGETANVPLRLDAHLRSAEKGVLEDLRLITSPQFNKSAALHLEAKLISYISGDGKLDLVNRNAGRVDHHYYQQERYDQLFEELWDRLRSEQVAEQTLEQIDNSDLFKFSPYKSLSPDQYTAVARIITHLVTSSGGPIVVRGAAGTGKTVLAIFLMKLLSTEIPSLTEELEVPRDEDELSGDLLRQLKDTFPKPRIGLVVAMTSLRNTIADVFRQVHGLSAKQVIGPVETTKLEGQYDILIVDEAHRLRARRAIVNYKSHDDANRRLGFPKDGTELDWILAKSKHTILFYDKGQSVRPSDIDAIRFTNILEKGPVFDLATQHRSKGGVAFTKFVKDLLDDKWQARAPFDAREGFEIMMYDDFGDLVENIKALDKKLGLSRIVAGFAWPWISKNDKSAIDIKIDGVEMQWNMTADNWINSPNAVNEIGCIHTTQGYDLNYVGVVFGHEIGYDPENGRIVVYKDQYHDKKGKQGVYSEDQLSAYIKQIYYTILCRGMRGVFVYVCDKDLRAHFKSFFKQYKASSERKAEPLREAKIIPLHQAKPYIDSIPYFDIAAAAGEFSETQMSEHLDWLQLEEGARIEKDYFACKVIGESMNKRISNGSICLFSKNTAGSNQGKIVLAEHRKFEDSEFGAGYTIKQYSSIKKVDGEFDWSHESVHLKPLSNDSGFETIVLTEDEVEDLKIMGEFLRVVI